MSQQNIVHVDDPTSAYIALTSAGGGSITPATQVSVDQKLTTGVEIGGVTVDGQRTALYAPPQQGGGGGGSGAAGEALEFTLAKHLTLDSNVASIVISQDDNGDPLNIEHAFYLEGMVDEASSNPANAFSIYLTDANNTEVLVSGPNGINVAKNTYFNVLGQHIVNGKWGCLIRTGYTPYDEPINYGSAVASSEWNAMNYVSHLSGNAVKLTFKHTTGNYGAGTELYLYTA